MSEKRVEMSEPEASPAGACSSELLWSLRRRGDGALMSCELTRRGEPGWECQIFLDGSVHYARAFDGKASAIEDAEVRRSVLEAAGWTPARSRAADPMDVTEEPDRQIVGLLTHVWQGPAAWSPEPARDRRPSTARIAFDLRLPIADTERALERLECAGLVCRVVTDEDTTAWALGAAAKPDVLTGERKGAIERWVLGLLAGSSREKTTESIAAELGLTGDAAIGLAVSAVDRALRRLRGVGKVTLVRGEPPAWAARSRANEDADVPTAAPSEHGLRGPDGAPSLAAQSEPECLPEE
jgi:hypothetical protein